MAWVGVSGNVGNGVSLTCRFEGRGARIAGLTNVSGSLSDGRRFARGDSWRALITMGVKLGFGE